MDCLKECQRVHIVSFVESRNIINFRVQILLASVLELGDKSGLNKKSLINETKTESSSDTEQKIKELRPDLKRLFEIFWKNLEYISNPAKLADRKRISVSNKEREEGEIPLASEGLMEFLKEIQELLTFFRDNQIETNENTTIRYPKYIKDPKLFEYQLNEPYFRKCVLFQLRNLVVVIENPIKNMPSFGQLGETEKSALKSFQDSITFILKRYKSLNSKNSLHTICNKVFKTEIEWINWKIAGCPELEKFLTEEEEKRMIEGKRLSERDCAQQKAREEKIKSWRKLNKEYSHMGALSKDSLYVSYYLTRLIKNQSNPE